MLLVIGMHRMQRHRSRTIAAAEFATLDFPWVTYKQFIER
jgi:hypothetical protein